ncbi:MAG: CopG family transcriptional regulator [Candidatus Nanohalobium sp.]
MSNTESKRVTTYLAPELHEKLKNYAETYGLSKSEVLRQGLMKELKVE